MRGTTNKFHRLISALLVLVMLIGVLPASALAAEPDVETFTLGTYWKVTVSADVPEALANGATDTLSLTITLERKSPLGGTTDITGKSLELKVGDTSYTAGISMTVGSNEVSEIENASTGMGLEDGKITITHTKQIDGPGEVEVPITLFWNNWSSGDETHTLTYTVARKANLQLSVPSDPVKVGHAFTVTATTDVDEGYVQFEYNDVAKSVAVEPRVGGTGYAEYTFTASSKAGDLPVKATQFRMTGAVDTEVSTNVTASADLVNDGYAITVTAPDRLAVNQAYTDASASLAVSENANPYTYVVFKINVTGPEGSHPEIMAADAYGTYNLAETGQWGPDSGFQPVPATTPFTKLSFDKPGVYTAEFKLVEVGTNKVICSGSKTITVVGITDVSADPSSVVAGEPFTVRAETSLGEGSMQFEYGTQKVAVPVVSLADGTGYAEYTLTAETNVVTVTATQFGIAGVDQVQGTASVTVTEPDTYYTVTLMPGAADAYLPFTPNTESVKEGEPYTFSTDKLPTRDGYTFQGWNDGTQNYTYSSDTGFSPASVTVNGDVTLNAQWETEKVTVTYPNLTTATGVDYRTGSTLSPVTVEKGSTVNFVLNVAEGYDPSTLVVKAGELYLNPVKTADNMYQYSFVANADTTIEVTDPSKLTYAVMMPVGHFMATITGVTGNSSTHTNVSANVEHGGSYTFTVKAETGYEIKAVYVNGVAQTFDAAESTALLTFTVDNVTSAQTVQVVADEVPSYNVIFVIPVMGQYLASQSVTRGEKATAPVAPEKEGYTFKGWYTVTEYAKESGTTFDFDSTAIDKDTVLYGKFEANTYTIKYDLNYAGAQKINSSTTKTYGMSVSLRDDNYLLPLLERDGYTFLGWSRSKNAVTASYYPGDMFSEEITEDITLYAVWEQNTYTVTLPVGTGYTALPTENSSSPVNYDGSYSFTVTVDPGYAVQEPTVTANGTSLTATGPTQNTNGSKTYTYTIEHIQTNQVVSVQVAKNPVYTVTFQYTVDGVTTIYQTQQVEHGYLATQPVAPVVEGYKFEGWQWDVPDPATGATKLVNYDFSAPVTGNVTLIAKLTAIEPEVSWIATGTGWTLQVTSANVTDTTNDEIDATPNKVTFGSTMEFTITVSEGYDASALSVAANGLALAPVEVTEGTTNKTTDYKFVLTNITADQKITVTGVERKTVTVTYSDNGGYGGPVQEQVPYYVNGLTNGAISTVTPVRPGYEFRGWATTNNTGNVEYNSGDTADFTADTVLYAIWQAKTAAVTLTASVTEQYEGEDVTLTAEVKSGAADVTSGSVQFYRSNNSNAEELIGTAKVSGGKAVLTIATSDFVYDEHNTDSYTVKFIPDEGSGYSEADTTSDPDVVNILSTAISWELSGSSIADKGNVLTITDSNSNSADNMVAGQVYTLTLPGVYALDDQAKALTVGKDYNVTWQYRDSNGTWTDYTAAAGGNSVQILAAYSQYVFRAVVTPITGATSHFTQAASYSGTTLTADAYVESLITEATAEVTSQQTSTALTVDDTNDLGSNTAEFEGQTVTLTATVTLTGTTTAVTTGEVYFYKNNSEIGKANVQSDGTAVLEATISTYTANTSDVFKAVYQKNATYETSTSNEASVLVRSTAIAWTEETDGTENNVLAIDGFLDTDGNMIANNLYTLRLPAVVEEGTDTVLQAGVDYTVTWHRVNFEGTDDALATTNTDSFEVAPTVSQLFYYAEVNPKAGSNYTDTVLYDDAGNVVYGIALTTEVTDPVVPAPTTTTIDISNALENKANTPDFSQYEGASIRITATVLDKVQGLVPSGYVTFYVVNAEGDNQRIGKVAVSYGEAYVDYTMPAFKTDDTLDNIEYFFAIYTDPDQVYDTSNTTDLDVYEDTASQVGKSNIDNNTEAVRILSTTISWKLDGTKKIVSDPDNKIDANKLTIYEGEGTTGDTADAMVAGSTYTLELPAVYALDDAQGATNALTVNRDYIVTWQYLDGANGWKDYTSTADGNTVLITPDYSGYQFRAVVTPIYDNDALTGYDTAAEYNANDVVTGKTQYLYTDPTEQTVHQTTTTTLAVTETNDLVGGTVAEFEGQTVTLTATVKLEGTNTVVTTGEVYFYRVTENTNDNDELLYIAEMKSDGTAVCIPNISEYAANTSDVFYAVYQTNDTYNTSTSGEVSVRIRSTAIAWLNGNVLTVKDANNATLGANDKMIDNNTYTLELPTVVEDGQSTVELTVGTDYTVTWIQVNPDGTIKTLETTENDTFDVTPTVSGTRYYAQVNPKAGSNYADAYQDNEYQSFLTTQETDSAQLEPTTTTIAFGNVLTDKDNTPDFSQYEETEITITATVLDKGGKVVPGGYVTFYVVTAEGANQAIKQETVSNGKATVTYTLPAFDPDDGLKNIEYFFAIYTDADGVYETSNTTAIETIRNPLTAKLQAAYSSSKIDKETEAVQILSTSISWALTTEENALVVAESANKLTIYEGNGTTGNKASAMTAGQTYTLELPTVYALDEAKNTTKTSLTVNTDYTVTWQYWKTDVNAWVDYISTAAGDTVLITPDYSGYQFRAVVTPKYDNASLTGYKTAADYDESTTNNVTTYTLSGTTQYLVTVPTAQTVHQNTATTLAVTETNDLTISGTTTPAEFEGQTVTLTATVKLEGTNTVVTTGEVYFYRVTENTNDNDELLYIAEMKSDGTAVCIPNISGYAANKSDEFYAVYQTNETYYTSTSETESVLIRSTAIAWLNGNVLIVKDANGDELGADDKMIDNNTYTLTLPTVVEDGQSTVELTVGTDYTVTWIRVNPDGTIKTLENTETDTFDVTPTVSGTRYYAEVHPKAGSNYTDAYQDSEYQSFLTTQETDSAQLEPTSTTIAFDNVLTDTGNTPDFSQYEETSIRIIATVLDNDNEVVPNGYVTFYVVNAEGENQRIDQATVSDGQASVTYTLPAFDPDDGLKNIEYFFAIYTDADNVYDTSNTTDVDEIEDPLSENFYAGDVTVDNGDGTKTTIPSKIDKETEAVQILSTSISWKLEAGNKIVASPDANKLTIYEADEDGLATNTTVSEMIAGSSYVLELPAVYALDYALGNGINAVTTERLTCNEDYKVTWQYREYGASEWLDYTNRIGGDTVLITPEFSGYQFQAVVTPIYDNEPLSNYKTAARYNANDVVDGKTSYLVTDPTEKTIQQPTTTGLVITGADREAADTLFNGQAQFTNAHWAQFEGQNVTLKATVTDNATTDGVTVGYVNFYRYVDGTNDVLLNAEPVPVGANGVAQWDVEITEYDTNKTAHNNVDKFYAVYLDNATYKTSNSLRDNGTPHSINHAVYIKSTTIQTPIILSAEPGKINGDEAYETTYTDNLTDLEAGIRHTFTLKTGAEDADWSVVALDGREVDASNYDIQWLVTTGTNEEQAANDQTAATFVVENSKSGDQYRVKLIAKNDMTVDAYSKYAIIDNLQNVTVLVTASDEIESTDATDVYQLNYITLTAEVQGRTSQIMLPSGNVTFYYSVDGKTWVEIDTAALKLDDVTQTMKATIKTDVLPVNSTTYKQQDVIVTAVYLGDKTFNPSDNWVDKAVTPDDGKDIKEGDYVQSDEVTVYSSVVFVSDNDENKAPATLTDDGIHISVSNGSLIANETQVLLELSQIYTLDHAIELSKLTYGVDYTVQWQKLTNASLYNEDGYYGGTEKWTDVYNETGSTYTIPTVEQDAAYRARITVVNDAAPVQGSAQGVLQKELGDSTTGRQVYYSNVLIVGAGQATVTTNITTSKNQNFNEEGIVEGETVTIHALVAGAATVTPISKLTATIVPQGGKEPIFTAEETNVDGYNFFTWNTSNVTPGYYTLTIVATSNNGYEPQTITRTLIVRDNNYTLTATNVSKVYNGQAQGIDWTLTGIDIENTLAQASVVVHYKDQSGNLVEPTQAGTYSYELILPASAYWTEQSVTGTFEITRRSVSIEDLVAQAKVYDGTQNVNLLEIVLHDAVTDPATGLPSENIGLINGDSVYVTGSGWANSANAGETTVEACSVELKGDDAANYVLYNDYKEPINIQRSQVKGDIADAIYAYGTTAVPATDIYLIDQAGNVIDKSDYTVTYYYHSGDGDSVQQVNGLSYYGMYTVIARPDQSNYKGGAVETIYVADAANNAQVSTTAVSTLIDITNTVELYGNTNGITATATTGSIEKVEYNVNGSYTTDAPKNAGRYLVKATASTGDVAYGLYTIVKAHPGLELAATDATYNSAQITGSPDLTFMANKSDSNAEVYYTWTGGAIQGVAYQAPTEAGTYVVTAHVGETDNYTAHEVSAVYTIAPKPLTITADDLQRWQYGSFPDMVATYTGLATGGVAADTSLRDIPVQPEFIFNEANGGYTNAALDQVGLDYTITVRNALAPNYAVTYVAGNYAVTREEPRAELAIHGMIDNGTDVENIAYYGDQIQLYAYGYYQANSANNGTGVYNTSSLLQWSVSKDAPATIDQDGLLTITGTGTFTVTLTRGTGSSALSTSISITALKQEVKLNVANRDVVYTGRNYTYSITNSNVNAVDAKAAAVKAINTDKANSIQLVEGSSNVRLNVGSQVVTVELTDSVDLYVSEAYGGLFTLNDKETTVAPVAQTTVYGTKEAYDEKPTYTVSAIVNKIDPVTNVNVASVADAYDNLDVYDGYEILVAGTENKNYNVKYITDQTAEDVEVTAKPLTVETGTINGTVGRTSGSVNPADFYPTNGNVVATPWSLADSTVRMYGEPNWVMVYGLNTLVTGDSLADLAELPEWLVKFDYANLHNIAEHANLKYPTKELMTGEDDYVIDSRMSFKNYTVTQDNGIENIYQRPVTLSTIEDTNDIVDVYIADAKDPDALKNAVIAALKVEKYNGVGGLATLLNHTIEDLKLQLAYDEPYNSGGFNVTITIGNPNYWSEPLKLHINVVKDRYVVVYNTFEEESAQVTVYQEEEDDDGVSKRVLAEIPGGLTFEIYVKNTDLADDYNAYKESGAVPVRSGTMNQVSTGVYTASYKALNGTYKFFALPTTTDIIVFETNK